MKSQIFRTLFLTSIILSLFQCKSPTIEEQVLGKWAYDTLYTDEITPSEELSTKDQFGVAFMKGMMKGYSVQFFEDKTFENYIQRGTLESKHSGDYEIINDGKYLVLKKLTQKNEVKTEKWEVLQLIDDTLKVKTDKELVMRFVRQAENESE